MAAGDLHPINREVTAEKAAPQLDGFEKNGPENIPPCPGPEL